MNLPKEYKYAYHRTASADNVESIAKNGFTPGNGDMYGKGWYNVFNLKSALRDVNGTAGSYGDFIIKSEIFPKGIICFDYVIAKEMFGAKYRILDQLEQMEIYRDRDDAEPYWWEMDKACDVTLSDEKVSADLAYWSFTIGARPSDVLKGKTQGQYSQLRNGVPINKKINAIMFSGRNDGDVIVVYNSNTLKPESYSEASLNMIRDGLTEKNIKFLPIQNVAISNKRAENLRKCYDIFDNKLNLEIKTDILDVNTFRQKYKWLYNAKIDGGKITIDENGDVFADNVIWISGEWQGKEFSGTFKSGKFMSGKFLDLSNTGDTSKMIYGVFEGDEFDAWWYGGTFKKGKVGPNAAFTPKNKKMTYYYDGDFIDSDIMNPNDFFASMKK